MLQEQLAGAERLDWSRVIVDASLVEAKEGREGRAHAAGPTGSRFHLAVDARGAPLEVRLAAGNANEQRHLLPLVDALGERGIQPNELNAADCAHPTRKHATAGRSSAPTPG